MKYPLNLSRNYVSGWSITDAVRELIQNALDSGSCEITFAGNSLSIVSQGEITKEHLLLGNSSKGEGDIGQFGEGLKLALLVLTREGSEVTVNQYRQLWTVGFGKFNNIAMEQLYVKESKGSNHANTAIGTVDIRINPLTVGDILHIKQMYRPLHTEGLGKGHDTKYGRILTAEREKGNVYVSGLFVCTNAELEHGYDILPEHITLNRDRGMLDTWDLLDLTQQMWLDTELYEDIAIMMEADVKDVAYTSYNSHKELDDACYDLFQKKHKGKVPVADQAQADRYRTYGGGTYYTNSSFNTRIRRSSRYRHVPETKPEGPEEWLRALKETHNHTLDIGMKAIFNVIIEEAAKWEIAE